MKRLTFLLAYIAILSFIVGGCSSKSLKPEAHLAGTESGMQHSQPIQSANSMGSDVMESSDLFLEDWRNSDTFGWGAEESLANNEQSLSPENKSKEYKKKHGRSTAPLYPIYFSFDSSSIHESQMTNINDDVHYLLDNIAVNVVIEGNTDNRGTREYNLALGERRAQSVKSYLGNLQNPISPL